MASIKEPEDGVKSGDSIRKRIQRPLPAEIEQSVVMEKVSVKE